VCVSVSVGREHFGQVTGSVAHGTDTQLCDWPAADTAAAEVPKLGSGAKQRSSSVAPEA